MDRFEDHFSQVARDYSRYRPGYPAELFASLAAISPQRRLAWDCGTGNGQAAVGLARHFERVIATEPSSEQLAQALPNPRVEYRQERAEASSLEAGSAGLITVAIAVHWFDLDLFYQEARRVLVEDGVLAVWCYYLPIIQPEIDRVLDHYYTDVLAGFWPERQRFVHEHYQTLPFPFQELDPPAFEMQSDWNLEQVLGFMSSWSATRRYEAERGSNPLELIWEELSAAWGSPERKLHIRWPLYLRVGK